MKEEFTTNEIKVKDEKINVLKKSFSHCFDKNGRFDFNKFKKDFSKQTDLDFSNESYGMDWLGKSYARLLASDEATTLLKEDKGWNEKEENKKSENLLIKGDNLEVLKHLSNAYHEKIKMIYIDPPYNTGSDGFVYEDDRKFTTKELSELAGIDEERAKRILDFTQSQSNSHSAWLTFMYPRLYIAKHLLKDDGVIFISIDDNEVSQLRILMDEIFGEENFVGIATRKTRGYATTKGDAELQSLNDYILIYFKSKSTSKFNKKIIGKKTYPHKDERGKYYLVPLQDNGPHGTREARPNLWYPIYQLKDGTLSYKKSEKNAKEYLPAMHQNKEGSWMWSKKKFDTDSKDLTVYNEIVYIKHYYDENEDQNKYQREKLFLEDFQNSKGTLRLNDIFQRKGIFNNPKPTEMLRWCLKLSTSTNTKDLILDFFAGSGTTADAVMQLNVEDGGNRKYILVQLPEIIDPKKDKIPYDFVKNELKVDTPTIFEITKERLIRSAKKIKEDNKKKDLSKQDFGFKIFETVPIWEDYNIEAEEFNSQTQLFDESKLTKEDLQTLLTTWKTYDGFSLTEELNEKDLGGYKGYYLGSKLYLVDKGFETKHLKKLLEVIDADRDFSPASIVVFGYNFDSKSLREMSDNLKNYTNKKQIEIDFITRY